MKAAASELFAGEPVLLTLPVGGRDHVQGPDEAPITLVEYGDYACPFCGRAYPVIKDIRKLLGSQLRFIFRHFPLTKIHAQAQQAAEAAEAAAAQGRFWEMHDALFEHQHALAPADLSRYAGALGLDRQRFERELVDRVHEPRVREDFRSGLRSGVNGTPTFFINGIRYDGAVDADLLMEALRAEFRTLIRARALPVNSQRERTRWDTRQ